MGALWHTARLSIPEHVTTTLVIRYGNIKNSDPFREDNLRPQVLRHLLREAQPD